MQEHNMRRFTLLFLVLLAAFGMSLSAQESTEVQESEPEQMAITVDAGLGFPTQLAVGLYWPNNMFELPNGILSGIEVSVGYGTPMKAPIIFANKDQNELTDYAYTNFPDPAPDSIGNGFGLRSYLTVLELDLGFASLPMKTGFLISGGTISGSDDSKYMLLDFMLGAKIQAELSSFKLLKPYLELGIGGGSATPMNDAAKEAVSGLDYNTGFYATWDTDEYTKWWNGRFNYTNVMLNVGVRYELPSFWNRKKDEPKEEETAEPETMELISEFQFPEWLMERGGMTYFPDGATNPLAGSVIVGPQKVFRNYSFKHQSSYKSDKFNYKYKPESIVEIVQADEEIYHVILENDAGDEMEYKLYRLDKGETTTIDGEEIDPVDDGVYFEGNEYHTMDMDM